jgi:hypothetical protein
VNPSIPLQTYTKGGGRKRNAEGRKEERKKRKKVA